MSHKVYEVGDYSSSESEEKDDSNSDTDVVLAVRRGGSKNTKPVFTSAINAKSKDNNADNQVPITRRSEFSNDYEEETKEDVMHTKRGRQHMGNVIPAVANLELAEAVGMQKSKPKELEKKRSNTKGVHKGQSLTSDDAVAFMIKERQAMEEEYAIIRRENNKLKEDLKIKQEQSVVEKIIVDPNSRKQQADLERLRQENLDLKRKKDHMEVLLQSKAVERSELPVDSVKPTKGKSMKAPTPTRREEVSESSSEEGESDSGGSSTSESQSHEEPPRPQRKEQQLERQKAKPVKKPAVEKKPSPKKGQTGAVPLKKAAVSGPEVSLPLTGKKFNALPSILWEGGKLWKIPYNGKGMPEERMVMIKRALRPGPQARPVRVLSRGEESSDGAVSVPVAYVSYPPAIIWYNADKPNEAKFAREISLLEGAYLVDGHQTPAFWKLVNRGSPMPPKELCFSIVTSNRTLDLAAETLREANAWKNAIHMLLVMMTTSKEWGIQNLHRATPTWHHDSMLKETAANVKAGVKPVEHENPEPQPKVSKSGVMKEQMFTATRLNNFAALDDLLRSGVPVNLMEAETGDTPLMVACRKNFPVIAKLCLDYGAKNDPHPDFGQTALHAAVAAGSYDCVDVLLDAAAPSGADATISNLPDPRGETPLHTAAMLGHGEISELLISHGGQIVTRDSEGKNAIHLSSVAGHRGCLAIMLDQGGDEIIEERDNGGNTALHLAAEYGHLKVAKLLLETAANPSARNGKGHTPYAIASAKGHHQVGILLLEYSSSTSSPGSKRGKRFVDPGLGRRAVSDSRAQLEQERLRQAAFGANDDDYESGGTFSLDVQDHQPQRVQLQRQNSYPGQGSTGLPRPHTSGNIGSPTSAFPRPSGNNLSSPLAFHNSGYGNNDYRGGMHSARDYDYLAHQQDSGVQDLYNPMTARERPAPALFEGLNINKYGSNNPSLDRQYSGSPGRNVVNGDKDMEEYYSYVKRNNNSQAPVQQVMSGGSQFPFSPSNNRGNGDFYLCPPDSVRSPSPNRGMRTPVQQQQQYQDYSSEQYSYAAPLEEFSCLGHHWQLFQTDEGYYYYLIEASGHSQWDDPRTHGYQEFSEGQDYTEQAAAAAASPLKSPAPTIRQSFSDEVSSPPNAAFKHPKAVAGKSKPVERVKHVRAVKRAPKKIELDVTPTMMTPDTAKKPLRKAKARKSYDDEDTFSSDQSFSTDDFNSSSKDVLSSLRQQSSLDELRSSEKPGANTTDDDEGYMNGEVPEIRLVERKRHSPAKLLDDRNEGPARSTKPSSTNEYFSDVSGFVRRNMAPLDMGSEEEEEGEDYFNAAAEDPDILDIDGIPALEDNLLVVPSPEKEKLKSLSPERLEKAGQNNGASTPVRPGVLDTTSLSRTSPSVEDIKDIDSYWRQSSANSEKRTPRSRAKMAMLKSDTKEEGALRNANAFETTRSATKPVYSDEDDDTESIGKIIEGEKKMLPPRNNSSRQLYKNQNRQTEGQDDGDWDAANVSQNECSDWDEEASRAEPLFPKRLMEEDLVIEAEPDVADEPTEPVAKNYKPVQLAPILKPNVNEHELLRQRQFSSDGGGYGNGGNIYEPKLEKKDDVISKGDILKKLAAEGQY